MVGIHEIFLTLQGEGRHAGRPAVFVRLAGCNLWSGRDDKRAKGRGVCSMWCDTDFSLKRRMSSGDVVSEVRRLAGDVRFVVITGGEPMLQLRRSSEWVGVLRRKGFEVAVETNGTVSVPAGVVDHVCVSPKGLKASPGFGHLKQRAGDDLKVVAPLDDGLTWQDVEALSAGFGAVYVQPRDTQDAEQNKEAMRVAIEAASSRGWLVSLQTHKLAGLP